MIFRFWSKSTKKEHSSITTLADVRAMFDAVIGRYSEVKSRLFLDSIIVHNGNFESDVLNIQEKGTSELNEAERKTVKGLLHSSKITSQSQIRSELSFADSVVFKNAYPNYG